MSIPGKKSDHGVYTFEDRTRRSSENTSRWNALRIAVYNPSTGKFLGRTRSSWGIVGLFYLVFFSVLAVLCAICYRGLMLTIDKKIPTYILEESLIGTNPGLGYRPMPDNIDQKSLVWYNAKNATDVAVWTKRIDKFLSAYVNRSLLSTQGRNQQICNDMQPLLPGNVCAVDVTTWEDCSPGGSYGYNNSAPCFFIKLNKIYGWVPHYYDTEKPLPSDMPKNISDHIINDPTLKMVWVSCHGRDSADEEVIGDIEYYPKLNGFPDYYYPYTNTPGYLSPLVAVRFLRPKTNVIINVECRAWAKNIHYSGKTLREGSVLFSFMIDD